MLYWGVYHAQGLLNNAKVMLTIHNMDNTGECRRRSSRRASPGEFNTLEKAMDERTIGHNPERLCLMKGAMRLLQLRHDRVPDVRQEALNGSAVPG